MIGTDDIEQKFSSYGSREGLLLNKRLKALRTLLETLEERLALIPSEDRHILRSMYYQSLIDVTHSYYLCAEKMVATKAIRRSSSKEEEDKIMEELKERTTQMVVLCDACD